MINIKKKICKKCNVEKNIDEFVKNKNCKDGYENTCKLCRKKYNKKYNEENKEKISEKNKEYYCNNKEEIKAKSKEYYNDNKDIIAKKNKVYRDNHKEELSIKRKEYYENNKDVITKRNNLYYENNKEHMLEYKHNWYIENKEHCSELRKKWREDNPDKYFNNNAKRRFNEDTLGNGITKEQWYECFEFFNWECAYSGVQLDKDNRSLDHIVALDNGGEHEIWNCVPMYINYNSQKQTKDILEWYLEQPFFSIERLTKIYEWRIYAYWKYFKK